MAHKSTFLLLTTVALLSGRFTYAQPSSPEAPLPAAAEQLRQDYAAASVNLPYIYNGPEYADYTRKYHTLTGHQFYAQPEILTGSVQYNEREFNNLRLQYDLVLDQVVLSQPGNPLRLRLLNEKVRSFSLGDRRFVRLMADSANAGIIRTGYYELLADGRVQVLAKHTKKMYEHIDKPYVDVSFAETTRLFMQKAGHYYAIRSKGAALRLFADHAPEIQQYIKEHHLRFNKASRESSVAELARYYNGLPH